MKKKKVIKKSKNNSSKNCKMSLKQKELMAVAILVFFVCAFLLTIVNTPRNNISITGNALTKVVNEVNGETYYKDELGNRFKDAKGTILIPGEESFIRDLFTRFQGEKLDLNIGKFVIWFTMFFFIFGILGFFKFPPLKKGGGFIRAMLSLGLSFLMTAYLIPENIYTIIMSLETVPMMITTLPFIALLIGTGMLLSVDSAKKLGKMNVGRILGVMALWFVWAGFLVFRIIRAWMEKGFSFIFRGGGIVLLFILLPSVLILIFFPSFQKWITKLSKGVIKMRADVLGTAEGARLKRESMRSSFGSEEEFP